MTKLSDSDSVLSDWKKQIDSFKKLKIEEAQELYRKYISASDQESKDTYINELVLGTLYILYDYITKHHLEFLCSARYDMGDIINVFNEVWIKKIYDGELLNVSNFSAIFSGPFFEQICNKLDGDELVIHEQFRMNINTFIGLFLIFVESKNKGISLSFDDILREYLKEDYEERKNYYDDYCRMVILFESIYKKLNINEEDDLDISRTKIYRFLKLLIKNALMKEKLEDSLYYDGMEDSILNKIYFENFVFDVDSVLTKKRGCEIIHQEYGLDCTPKDRRTISIDSKISTERVKIEERKALSSLKRSAVMQKYK